MDKETSLMDNLLWARILVKIEGSGRPTSVILLAGARSYKIQLWWEIQPRVTEVYPCRIRRETEMVNLVVEDEGKTRALQRVTADREARRHYPRVVQGERGQWQALCSSGANDSLCQNLKCAGAISQRQVQNNLWERREEVGNKLLSPRPHHGDEVGQNPSGPQGFFASQSPRQKFKDKRPTVSSCMENQKPENAGRMGEKARETGSPNLAKSQISDTTGDEEEGDQEAADTKSRAQKGKHFKRGREWKGEKNADGSKRKADREK